MTSLRTRPLWLAVAIGVTACAGREAVATASSLPATRTVDAAGVYHGTTVPDPWRWLEALESSEVRAWAAAQTAHALRHLRRTETGPRVLARMDTLAQLWSEPSPTPTGDPDEPSAPPVDPASLAPGERLDDLWVSPTGEYAAYTVTRAGVARPEGRVRRLSDGRDLEERLTDLDGRELVWSPDGRGFFHGRITRPAFGGPARPDERAVSYHAIGTPPSQDVEILRTGAAATEVFVDLERSTDGRFLVMAEGTGPHVTGLGHLFTRLHLLDLREPTRAERLRAPVALSATRDAAYRLVAAHGDTLFVLTDRDAPRRRLVAVALDARDPARWRDVVPEGDDVIDAVQAIGDRFVVRYVRDVQHGVRVYTRDGRLVRELPIRPMTTILRIHAAGAGALVVEALEGFAPTRRRYALDSGRDSAELEVRVPSPVDSYEVRQVWYASRDGVRVPMFLAHRRGLSLDGSSPAILSGYGASSSIEMPRFGPGAVALLELGFVLASPSLRGGGEFGRAWYEAGTLGRKHTTFDDFIAAAEYLVREGYTSASRLAIAGVSNGGLLVSSVITQRPDLFRVAVAEVPPTDLLRFDPGPHRAQYGSPDEPAHVPFLLASSALHHVRPDTCYPATLITTAFDDDVIPAWNGFKFAAALQAAQSCERPVLLRADTTGGHGGPGARGAADMFGFIVEQLGVGRTGASSP